MRQLGSLFHVAMNGISACKKLFTYLELPEQEYGEVTLSSSLDQLKIEHVDFRYAGSEALALNDVSLLIKRGEFTAFVGQSGSGKSTIVRLLLHQLSQYEGRIYWNQDELKTLSQETIQQTASLVDNHGYLYPTTIKENLLLGNEKGF